LVEQPVEHSMYRYVILASTAIFVLALGV